MSEVGSWRGGSLNSASDDLRDDSVRLSQGNTVNQRRNGSPSRIARCRDVCKLARTNSRLAGEKQDAKGYSRAITVAEKITKLTGVDEATAPFVEAEIKEHQAAYYAPVSPNGRGCSYHLTLLVDVGRAPSVVITLKFPGAVFRRVQ